MDIEEIKRLIKIDLNNRRLSAGDPIYGRVFADMQFKNFINVDYDKLNSAIKELINEGYFQLIDKNDALYHSDLMDNNLHKVRLKNNFERSRYMKKYISDDGRYEVVLDIEKQSIISFSIDTVKQVAPDMRLKSKVKVMDYEEENTLFKMRYNNYFIRVTKNDTVELYNYIDNLSLIGGGPALISILNLSNS